MVTRAKHARQVACTQRLILLSDLTDEEMKAGGRLLWVAVDTSGRQFADASQAEAEKMLTEYNHPKEP